MKIPEFNAELLNEELPGDEAIQEPVADDEDEDGTPVLDEEDLEENEISEEEAEDIVWEEPEGEIKNNDKGAAGAKR